MGGVHPWETVVGHMEGEEHRPVFELGLDNSRMRIAVWSYGATLVEVSVPGAAGRENLVVRLPDLAAYEQQEDRRYMGSTMGRYARIVAGGTARIGARPHQLAPNCGEHHIHGGPQGFDTRVWDGSVEGGAEAGRIVLSLVSPDGDQGYPGNLRCTAVFELHTDDRMVVRYEAVCDQPTLCGLTLHAFWNLTGSGVVDSHLLQVDADAVIEADEQFVPTGRLLPVHGTPQDPRRAHPLRGRVLDQCLALGTPPSSAELHCPATGRSMLLTTDQTCLAVYTGDHLPTPRRGVCLQPGPWPDAPNQSAFPSAELLPERSYSHETTYAFDWGRGN